MNKLRLKSKLNRIGSLYKIRKLKEAVAERKIDSFITYRNKKQDDFIDKFIERQDAKSSVQYSKNFVPDMLTPFEQTLIDFDGAIETIDEKNKYYPKVGFGSASVITIPTKTTQIVKRPSLFSKLFKKGKKQRAGILATLTLAAAGIGALAANIHNSVQEYQPKSVKIMIGNYPSDYASLDQVVVKSVLNEERKVNLDYPTSEEPVVSYLNEKSASTTSLEETVAQPAVWKVDKGDTIWKKSREIARYLKTETGEYVNIFDIMNEFKTANAERFSNKSLHWIYAGEKLNLPDSYQNHLVNKGGQHNEKNR